MRQALKLHPESRCTAVTDIEVEAARAGPGTLMLHYFVAGKLNGLSLPPVAAPMRGDELWRHTCFEAFLRASPDGAYYEFNFAPSTAWAAYRFGGYRSGMADVNGMDVPTIEVQSDGACFELEASLELDRLPGLPDDGPWNLGLSAVIEEAGGRRSYWALAHPPGEPDFHHSDCFALELPARERP